LKKVFLVLLLIPLLICACRDDYPSEKLEESESKDIDRGALDKRNEMSGAFAATAGEREFEGQFEEKVIRTGYVSIKSGKVKEAYEKTLLLVKKYEGIVVNSNMSSYETSEGAKFEIKVEPEKFLPLLDELKTVGKIESENISEEDVTEEFYDVEARLSNARKVQDRLFDLLKKAYRVEDILKVEREIERIGEKIETLEGRIKYLNSRTDYARITVNIYNQKISVIEGTGIKKGFIRSFKLALQFFFGIIWFIIILIPLIILIIVLWLIILWTIRRKRRRR